MPKLLKAKNKAKAFKIEGKEWEFWLFVVSLVTILGFFAQNHRPSESSQNYFRSQAKAELYDIRLPDNNRVVQDHLETGR